MRPAYRRGAGTPSRAAIEPFLEARRSREQALECMVGFARTTQCLMQYLCDYLGSPGAERCRQCTHCRDFAAKYERYRQPLPVVDEFLQARYPRIERCEHHGGGFVLDFHSGTEVGDALSLAKYGSAGVVPDWLVDKAAGCVRKKYWGPQSGTIDALTFIPPTSDRRLVEDFARRLARQLKVPCLGLLVRARQTNLQKEMKTRKEKRENVTGAFAVAEGAELPGPSLLLVDDIFDSGWTLREAARVLRRAFPECSIRVFALTRTYHSDND